MFSQYHYKLDMEFILKHYISIIIGTLSFLALTNTALAAEKLNAPGQTARNITVTSESSVIAINTVIQGLAKYHPEVVWDALPSSYQADINKILSRSSQMSDRDMFNKFKALSDRLLVAVKQKRAMIISTITKLAPPSNQKIIGPAVDAGIVIYESVSNSQFGDYDQAKNIDFRKFIVRHGAKIMKSIITLDVKTKQQFAMLPRYNAVEISRAGNIVNLDIMINGKMSGSSEAFVNVEGRWVPKKLADGWATMVAMVNMQLDASKANDAKRKEQMNKMLPALEQFVSNFEKIKTEAELQGLPIQVMLLGQQLQMILK